MVSWADPETRRRYNRKWMRQRRELRRLGVDDPTQLLEVAMARARVAHAELPRDPVLDDWRPGKVARQPFTAGAAGRAWMRLRNSRV